MRKRRVFTDDFKREASHLVIVEGRKISEVAESLGIAQGVLGRWVQQERERIDGPQSTEESQKIKDLEAEIRKLRMEKEVLKKAITFFGEDTK